MSDSIKQSPYTRVTDRIVAMLEAGTRPWSRPWSDDGTRDRAMVRPRRIDGTPYRGANVLALWAAGQAMGYSSPYWLTFQGALSVKGNVRKGERAEVAFYVGKFAKTEVVGGTEIDRVIPFLKAYPVFNACQCDNLPERFHAPAIATPRAPIGQRIPAAETFIANTGATINHGGNKAYYMPSADRVQMPDFNTFKSPEYYYGVMLHELGHWTGHDSRNARPLNKGIFGNAEYAFEELVAELTSAYLCADLEIDAEPREDHASYIASWIRCLKSDDRAPFKAAAHAERAAGYMHAKQPASLPDDLDIAA